MVSKSYNLTNPEPPHIRNSSPALVQVHQLLSQGTISKGTKEKNSSGVNHPHLGYSQMVTLLMQTTQPNANGISSNLSSYKQGSQATEDVNSHYQNPCMMSKSLGISSRQAFSSNNYSVDIPSSSQTLKSIPLMKYLVEDSLDSLASKSIGKFMLDVSLEPDVLQLQSFKDMVNVLSSGAQVVMPTYESILHQQLEEIQQRTWDLKKHWEKTGCSVILDSWKSQCGKSLMTVLVNSCGGMLFVKSIDVSAIIDDVDELASMICRIVEDVGVHNIVQVITNNASPHMQAAEHAVLKKHDSFFFTLCADYCINLLLENIAAIDHIKKVLVKAKEITRFIYSHELTMKLKEKYIKGRQIISNSSLKSVATFITIERLVSLREYLEKLFHSPELISSDCACEPSFRHIQELVSNDNAFWHALDNILKLVNPLVAVLYKLELDNCPMGILYDAIDSAKEEIKQNLRHNHIDYWSMIDQIWDNYLHSPIHAAGNILNPRIFFSYPSNDDTELSSGLTTSILQISKGHYDPYKLSKQMDVYLCAFDSDPTLQETLGISQVQWWLAHGSETPDLQEFAIRVLSQTCVGASRYNIDKSLSEKLHTVKRSFFEKERFRKMEYIHYNLLLARSMPCIGGASGVEHGKHIQLDDWISNVHSTNDHHLFSS